MQIVIDIPIRIYAEGLNEIDHKDIEIVADAIRHGKVLPKGHGRLIDADALRKSFQKSIVECHSWADKVNTDEMYARVSQALGVFVECSLRTKNASTIIEADKEGNSEKV